MLKNGHFSAAAAALCVALLLSACGGGGGSKSGLKSTQAEINSVILEALDPATIVARHTASAIARAVQATPRPGSVTQSSNVSNGITVDRVTVEAQDGGESLLARNGTRWSYELVEDDGQAIDGGFLIEITGTVESVPVSLPIAPMPANCGVGATLYAGQSCSYEGGGHSFTFAVRDDGLGCVGGSICGGGPVTINNFSARRNNGQWEITSLPAGAMPVDSSGATAEPRNADYMAYGIWLFFPNDKTRAADYVAGAFVDGSDPFNQNKIQALEGTASYVGDAEGLCSTRSQEGSEVGDWIGDVRLTADFGGRSDLGRISGSITGIEVEDEPYAGRLTLGTASIGSSNSGFFEGRVGGSAGEKSFTGKWGGQFFGNGAADGKPDAVAGTLGVQSSDGTTNFLGYFGATERR